MCRLSLLYEVLRLRYACVTPALRWGYAGVTLALLFFGLAVDISSHSKHEHVTRGCSRLRTFYEPTTSI